MTLDAETRHPLRVRRPDLGFSAADVPRHWFGGSAVASHMANGVNLLFPLGERFFVRSVRHFLDRIQDDPALLAQVKVFAGQEGAHAVAHERYFRLLEEQGYRIAPFLKHYDRIAYGFLEGVTSHELHLAITVALEHYTAIMAENALSMGVLEQAHPAVRALLLWHAAEEIEHKSVAFDVLARVNPSYGLRMAGMALATLGLVSFWAAATLMLLSQDGIDRATALAQLRETQRQRPVARTVFLRGLREYLRPGFHPRDNANEGLAASYLQSVGLA